MELSDDLKTLRNEIRRFAEGEIKPLAEKLDRESIFPMDNFKKLGELGYLGLPYPEKYGGANLGYIAYAILIEELARVCASTAITVAAQVSLAGGPIYIAGTEEQKEKYLTKLITGEYIGSFGLTEPNAGSDAGGTQTKAVKKDGKWIINGRKQFITNARYADVIVATARSNPKEKKTHGISAYIIEKGTPGFVIGKKEDKMGLRGSDTSEVIFEDCEIPEENLLGKEGEGFKLFMQTLDSGRIAIAALALGIAQAAYEASVIYAKQREQFGKKIAEFQGIQFKLADMATQIQAARLLVYDAAMLKDQGKVITKEGAMAKLFASEISTKVCLDAIQIHGGYGYTKDYPVERFLRDTKLMEIGEGTSEIQRIVIARQVLKEFE